MKRKNDTHENRKFLLEFLIIYRLHNNSIHKL